MTTAENTTNAPFDEVKIVLTERQRSNFWKKVSKAPHPNGCWEWTANIHRKGYGLFKFGIKTCKAHRISYQIANGPIPFGMLICHSCDNRRCVKPDHLFAGTDKDNCDDKMRKGRGNHCKGEENGGGRKLTWEKVREIRALRVSGLSQQAIADKYGVTQPMIGLIVRGEKWKE